MESAMISSTIFNSISLLRACSVSLTFSIGMIAGCVTSQVTPTVQLDPKGTKDIRGGLSEKEFIKVIHENLKDIRTCYETEFKKSKKTRGEIVTKIKVTQVGVVSTKTLKNTTKSKALGQCVNDAIESWKFPTSMDGKPTEISYPFIFEPL